MGVDKPVGEKKKVKKVKVKKSVKVTEDGSKAINGEMNSESCAQEGNGAPVVVEDGGANGTKKVVDNKTRQRNLPPVNEEKTVESHKPEQKQLEEKMVGKCYEKWLIF